MHQNYVVEMKNISKAFSGISVLQKINFNLKEGEVHCIVGENGAGKSTLIKILSGAIKPDEGDIFIRGERVILDSPKKAIDHGISTIYQEFNLCPNLSVAENIFLGDEHLFIKNGLIDKKSMNKEAKLLLKQLGIEISPTSLVKTLTVAQQQSVEICKALSKKAKIIIMDEPTAVLFGEEVAKLFEIIKFLKNNSIGVIYISHRLEEIYEIGDRVTILRDGTKIQTLEEVNNVSKETLISLMVGRKFQKQIPKIHNQRGKEILKVSSLTKKGVFKNISFSLHKGEILGFAGLVGSGRTEVMKAIFGATAYDEGTIFFEDKVIKHQNPISSIKSGIYLLPENRKEEGLILSMSISHNITISNLSKIGSFFRISKKMEEKYANYYVNKIDIKTRSLTTPVKFLSGGNQQKVLISRALFSDPKLIIFDEPTRGIDVNAKEQVYELINSLVEEDKGIIIISSELPEILRLCNRILVMREGEIVGELSQEKATQEIIMDLAVSGKN